ncbi:hypothetical protein CTA1_12521 [Colletotrichum tanaceti]|uniref:Uncharacterized protein n=1 Tax=Colletotrichum tanaceti TaxID=1306861 RepID=A0A4U6XCE8_9PEZI|nr:hypothetical protein CTA1_12521 [Colletotrichum tanaceti]
MDSPARAYAHLDLEADGTFCYGRAAEVLWIRAAGLALKAVKEFVLNMTMVPGALSPRVFDLGHD